MLGTTLWLLVALALVGGVLIDLAGAFGRTAVHAAADHAVESALHDAIADYQHQIANAYPGGTLPPPLQRTYAADRNAAPAFALAYDVEPTTLSAPACDARSSSTGSDAVGWLQCNAFVGESRLSLRVSARVEDAGGATLAQREQFVTLRLFAEPPYSALAGRKDGSAVDPAQGDALASPAHEGDAAGDSIAGAAAAPLASPWPSGGTLIHVRYECHDGAGACANAAPPDPDAGLRAGVRWENGNRPPP